MSIKKIFNYLENHLIKRINVGKNSKISFDCKIYGNKNNIKIGDNSVIGSKNTLLIARAKIIIGNYVMTGPEVMFITGNHRIDLVGEYMINVTNEMKLPENDQDIIIEDDVWIGARAIILKGVKIGEGSIIAAGAVVTKNIPPYSIYYGINKIKKRFTEEQIKLHKEILKNKK